MLKAAIFEGMKVLYLFLITLVSCTPSSIPNDSEARGPITPADSLYAQTPSQAEGETSSTLRYLALGDSYTIGESVAVEDRWPVQLADRISEETNLEIEDPLIIATTGWTTANLSNGMDQLQIDTAQYDLVSLLIGVNNQYQGLPLFQYEEEYTTLLERAIAIAGNDPGKVFVVSIPNYGFTPFGSNNQTTITQELNAFNASCQEITAAYGVAHYNITPISEQWPEVEGLVASDNLHPSGYQYELWVDSFWEDVVELLAD